MLLLDCEDGVLLDELDSLLSEDALLGLLTLLMLDRLDGVLDDRLLGLDGVLDDRLDGVLELELLSSSWTRSRVIQAEPLSLVESVAVMTAAADDVPEDANRYPPS